MLVLTRQEGESVMIGKDIEVSVQVIHGNQVKLGFEAPRNIPIVREEIVDEIELEEA